MRLLPFPFKDEKDAEEVTNAKRLEFRIPKERDDPSNPTRIQSANNDLGAMAVRDGALACDAAG
jgi:hypothetical protein